MDSNDDGSSSSSSFSTLKSSNSTQPVARDDRFDFVSRQEDPTENNHARNSGDESNVVNPSRVDRVLVAAASTTSTTSSTSDVISPIREVPSPSSNLPSSTILPHRGSLRRILNPSSFHSSQNTIQVQSHCSLNKSQATPSSWPMYVINVATEVSLSHDPDTNPFENIQHQQQLQQQQCYQLIFNRHQYEFCTRLFALLDTESLSAIGPDCIREFVCLHCPVVRRRDEAIFALRSNEEESRENRKSELFASATFDEIWERTINSDPRYTSPAGTPHLSTIHRIGIEGWMVFCRLLALAHHQESQRRFASRHLQQMMRHKHGAGATRMSSNEVVVVVDNPPPGPPSLVSICALVNIEQERVGSHSDECVQGWPFCPLPLPELDLDHRLASLTNNKWNSMGMKCQLRGTVSIEPFSPSLEGDFILRFHNNHTRMIVRRSYSDFEWLNTTLKLHKRPGQGHLCGHILPPFPSKQGHYHQKYSLISKETLFRSSGPSDQDGQDISQRAFAAAKSGIVMISSMANSVWSEYISGSTPSSSLSSTSSKYKATSLPKGSGSEEENVPMVVAHRIERYLKYLLENDALLNSFPLNAILQASQIGLESAKQTLQDYAKQKQRQKSNLVAASLRGGPHSAASIFSALISKTSISVSCLQDNDDMPWLRAAAQVAMALQFHGILETTGHETTSAKIQHASLPKFCNRPAGSWEEDETDSDRKVGSSKTSEYAGGNLLRSEANFEVGVINVKSELVDEEDLSGYDMLPLPGPSEEHCVLNAGRAFQGKVGRFAYETATEQVNVNQDRKDAVLGSIRVEKDIEKLRDIIRSISHTLEKLYQSSASIQFAQIARNMVQLGLLRDIHSWGDSGAEVISQRALVNGVAVLEEYNRDIEKSNKTMVDDLLWQSSLSACVVAAVGEVRDAVRASNTASRAKSAAFIAAEKAKTAYESCDHSSSKERIQYTQAEASNAQSHAIHATVVEYEANIAKKHSAVSLSQDVKSWNSHRKRELLQTCVQVAKSQQEACRKAADAWRSLRDGLIKSSVCSFTEDEVNLVTNTLNITQTMCVVPITQVYTVPDTETAYTNAQEILGPEAQKSSCLQDWESGQQDLSAEEAFHSCPTKVEGVTDTCLLNESQQSNSETYYLAPPNISNIDEDYFSVHQGNATEVNSNYYENGNIHVLSSYEPLHIRNDPELEDRPNTDTDLMSTSMQSLIDGLMAWGGDDEQQNREQTHLLGTTVGFCNDAEHQCLLE